MKKIFVYTSPIFEAQLLVCVGVNLKDIMKWADKNSKNLKQIYKSEENRKSTEDNMVNSGFVQNFVKDDLNYYILWLKDYKNKWEYIDVLNHEIVHYKQVQFKHRGIVDETEFEAYFIESTTRGIRRILNK